MWNLSFNLLLKGASLQNHHIHGLASFICSIAAHHSQMKQVLLTGIENPLALSHSSENQVQFSSSCLINIVFVLDYYVKLF